MLSYKADQTFVQDLIERLNNLEGHVYRPRSGTASYFEDEGDGGEL